MNSYTQSLFKGIKDMVQSRESSSAISSQIKDTLTAYVSSHCVHPRRISYIDKFTGESKYIFVPCGKCNHCRSMYQAQWSTRMILHTLYSAKFCYFVTLTYGSFNTYEEIPPVLRSAYYRKDTFNKYGNLVYSPCLLRHEHYQRFMKYLRKIHGDDEITFFQTGEYGSTFGRPHFHAILWSNEPISKLDVVRAWSARCPNSKATTIIGRVDFHDLNANGTVVSLDGKSYKNNGNNLHKAFNYVSKYITKQFVDPNNKVDSVSRLKFFISDLVSGLIDDTTIRSIFNNRVRQSVTLLSSWASSMSRYFREHDYQELCSLDDFYLFNKNVFYDYESSDFSFTVFAEDVCGSAVNLYERIKSWHMECPPFVFRKIFSPYCESSRLHAIGSDYVSKHLDEYSSGKFNLPTYNGKKLVFPFYFLKFTKQHLIESVCNEVRSLDGVSLSSNLLLRKAVFDYHMQKSVGALSRGVLSYHISPTISLNSDEVDSFIRGGLAFHDYIYNAKGIVFYDPSSDSPYVSDGLYIQYYRYSRNHKHYIKFAEENYNSFIDRLTKAFSRYSFFYNELERHRIQNVDSLEAYLNDMSHFCDTFLDSPYVDCVFDSYESYMTSVRDLQKRYYLTHIDKQ